MTSTTSTPQGIYGASTTALSDLRAPTPWRPRGSVKGKAPPSHHNGFIGNQAWEIGVGNRRGKSFPQFPEMVEKLRAKLQRLPAKGIGKNGPKGKGGKGQERRGSSSHDE